MLLPDWPVNPIRLIKASDVKRNGEREKNKHTQGGEKVSVGRRLLLPELIVVIHPNLDTHSDTCLRVFFMWEANPLLWVEKK